MLDNLQASDFVDNDANNSTVTFPLIPTGPNRGLEDMSNNEEGSTEEVLSNSTSPSGIPVTIGHSLSIVAWPTTPFKNSLCSSGSTQSTPGPLVSCARTDEEEIRSIAAARAMIANGLLLMVVGRGRSS